MSALIFWLNIILICHNLKCRKAHSNEFLHRQITRTSDVAEKPAVLHVVLKLLS